MADDNQVPNETAAQNALRRLRRDARVTEEITLIGYIAPNGRVVGATGSDEALYVSIAGQLAAINVIVAGGAAQQIMGDIAHDAVDLPLTSFPVKVGGFASAAPRANVSADGDRASASTDRRGRLRSRISGETGAGAGADVIVDNAANIIADESQIFLGVKDPVLGISTGAAVVTNAAGYVQQYLRGLVSRASTAAQGLFAVGNVAHDAADSNNPVKIGGFADDEAPASVSAVGDRVNQWHDLEGRAQVNHPQLMAGEDLVHHVLAVVEEPQSDEQHSMDSWATVGAADGTGEDLIKAAPGRIYEMRLVVAADVQADSWLMIINKATAPANADVPIWRVALPTGALECSDSLPTGLFCDTGIGIAISSTCATLTLVQNVAFFHAQYK